MNVECLGCEFSQEPRRLATIDDGLDCHLSEPSKGRAKVQVTYQGEALVGVLYCVIGPEKGSLAVNINHQTGDMKFKGRGSTIIRAIVGDRHFDKELVVN